MDNEVRKLLEEYNTEFIKFRRNVEDALENIGERERQILFLRYFCGKTQIEISNEIGISQAQVSRLEKSAISQIRNITA